MVDFSTPWSASRSTHAHRPNYKTNGKPRTLQRTSERTHRAIAETNLNDKPPYQPPSTTGDFRRRPHRKVRKRQPNATAYTGNESTPPQTSQTSHDRHNSSQSAGEPAATLIATDFVNSIRFDPRGFASSLTLSSKYFATFPHGTCLLSVSSPYLAFDVVYHQL